MARCGRCGLWAKYPKDHHEKKWAGVCLWYGTQLLEDEVYDQRKCGDFFERIPGMTPLQHHEYKVHNTNLRQGFITSRRAFWVSVIAVAISLSALGLSLLGVING